MQVESRFHLEIPCYHAHNAFHCIRNWDHARLQENKVLHFRSSGEVCPCQQSSPMSSFLAFFRSLPSHSELFQLAQSLSEFALNAIHYDILFVHQYEVVLSCHALVVKG